jgi:hypothetical protein
VGASGAENLIVRLEARGAFGFADPDATDEEDEARDHFDLPPKAPKTSMGALHDIYEHMNVLSRGPGYSSSPYRHITPVIARDRHAIYWEYEEDRMAKSVEGQCRDFRHGLEPIVMPLLVEHDLEGADRGAIEVLVSAGNLAHPQRMTVPVTFEREERSSESRASQLLEAELGVKVD